MKYRSRVDIIAAILKAAETGAAKTRLSRVARISFDQLLQDSYLPLLLSKGLLEHSKKDRVYRITDLGRMFLVKYQKIKI